MAEWHLHGRPGWQTGHCGRLSITLATAEDERLDGWKVRNDEVRITKEHPNYISDPKAAPGKYSWEEGNAWKQDGSYFMVGAGSHWDRINEQGKLQRHHHDAVGYDFPLYRSADLREWQHVGSFFTNPDPAKLDLGVECGQMIPLADGVIFGTSRTPTSWAASRTSASSCSIKARCVRGQFCALGRLGA